MGAGLERGARNVEMPVGRSADEDGLRCRVERVRQPGVPLHAQRARHRAHRRRIGIEHGNVARVETQQTFLNGLVGALTLGIYTPQSATITCAAGRTGALDGGAPDPRLDPRGHTVVAVADGASAADRRAALRSAAEESARTGQPVFVRF